MQKQERLEFHLSILVKSPTALWPLGEKLYRLINLMTGQQAVSISKHSPHSPYSNMKQLKC